MSLFAAIDAQGTTRYIGEVARGAACGCYCAVCQSPVVAKQGTDHVWHFAHEASQERPQCLPGSINLLRRLATEMLLESGSLVMPDCRQVVSTNWRHSVMAKKRQMRWSDEGAHLLVQVRVHELNGELRPRQIPFPLRPPRPPHDPKWDAYLMLKAA